MGEDGVLRNLLQQVKVCVGENIRLSLLYTVYLHVYHLSLLLAKALLLKCSFIKLV